MKVVNRMTFVLVLIISAISVNAQNYVNWEWTQYKIVFSLAGDFKPVVNTAEEFSAEGDGMEISIFPFKDKSISHEDIADYTLAIAESIEAEEYDDADVVQLNGLQGAFVEAYKDGDRVVILGFIDPASATNFFAVITFGDDDAEAEDEAVRIIKSFRKKR